MCDQPSLRSGCAYAQSDQSLCKSLEYSKIVKLLNEHHLEFLSLKKGCRGSSESTLIKMPHCCKSLAMAHNSIWCTAIKWDLKSCLLSEPATCILLGVCESRRLWRDCASAQALLSLIYSPCDKLRNRNVLTYLL